MDISRLIESIDSVNSSGKLADVDPEQRAQLYEACERLRSRCETPLDKTLRLLYTVNFGSPGDFRISELR
jgi:hypothetical protein